MKRNEKLELVRQHLNLEAVGLELGPHVDPMFRKSDGYNVRFLESRSADALRAAMKSAGRDPERVEEIDFILERDIPLSQNVKGETFGWVASSHVLEHIPDLVGHLNDVHSVLRDGGVYAAIVPDRNLCFDCRKAPTTLGDVLEAHVEKRTIPTLASNIDEFRYGARPEGVRVGGWAIERAKGPLIPKFPNWEERVRTLLDVAAKGDRIDQWAGHSWRFDPVSFGQTLADLARLDLIGLELTELKPTYHMDFIAILRKVPKVDPNSVEALCAAVAAKYRVPDYDVAQPEEKSAPNGNSGSQT